MNMKLIARSRAAFFKLCGKHALLSFLCAPQEFQRNSPAKTQAAARRSALPQPGGYLQTPLLAQTLQLRQGI